MRRLFVGNLGEWVEKEDLYELFSGYGWVVSAKVWFHVEARQSRGFGFVVMARNKDAAAAIEELDGSWWRGQRLRVSLARHQPDDD